MFARTEAGRRRLEAPALILAFALLAPAAPSPESVAVRYTEGITHGFLALRTLEGKPLADGDLLQTARGEQVTVRMVLRFGDGSLQEETTVFSQRGRFALQSYHLVQRGPSFPKPADVSIDVAKSAVTLRSADGREVASSERLEMPADLANGLVLYAIKNVPPGSAVRLSMIAAAPNPRLVHLDIGPAGEDSFSVGDSPRKASKYVVRVNLGGVAGVVAPLIGKQPQDTYVWITQGEAPTFVKMEGPLYADGPSWRLELANPTWGTR